MSAKERMLRRAQERRPVNLTTVVYHSAGAHFAVAMDRGQAATVAGILLQPLADRRGIGSALRNCLMQLRRTCNGPTGWQREPIEVNIRTRGGLIRRAEHPIVGRIALLVAALCFTDGVVEHIARQLERFAAFGDVPLIPVGELSPVAADILRMAA